MNINLFQTIVRTYEQLPGIYSEPFSTDGIQTESEFIDHYFSQLIRYHPTQERNIINLREWLLNEEEPEPFKLHPSDPNNTDEWYDTLPFQL